MDITGYVYTLAILAGVLTALVLYAVLIPKNRDTFDPDNSDKINDNAGLKVLMLLGSELYASMPEMAKRGNRSYEKHKDLIVRSGNPWGLKPEEFSFIRYVTAFIGGIVGFGLWALVSAMDFAVPWWGLVFGAALIGFLTPGIIYREQAKERDLEFKRQLPEALDLIIIGISAGNTFNDALRRTVPHLRDSVLKVELASVVKSVDSSKSMHQALNDFAERVPSTGIVSFIRSLQEANELNVSISGTLRSRSDESRAELFALIREEAAALPTKMTIALTPTLSFSLFIILLAPFITSLMAILG